MGEPGVAEALTRRLAATELLVCGRPGSDASVEEPIFLAGMRLTPEKRDLLAFITGRDGRDCVHIAFDIDDLEAEPAMCVLRPRGEFVIVDHGCQLWMAPEAKRAVIVPSGDGSVGSYAFRKGSQLVEAANQPASDLLGGMLRAEARVQHLVSSTEAAREELDNAKRCVTRSLGGGVLEHGRTRAAA